MKGTDERSRRGGAGYPGAERRSHVVRACVAGWGTAIPRQRLTNADLEQRVDTTNEWIVERTGIRERRIAEPGESTATLAVDAGAAAIKHAGITPDDVDLLIVATATPEQPVPHTGAFVGEALGLRCGSFDLAAGCAGFVYTLVTGSSLLTTGGLRHVLVIGSETLSRITDPDDRGTCILFGDAAAAAVLAPSGDGGPGLLAWDLGCDGSAAALLEIPAGGSRRPSSPETIAAGEHYLKMAGQEVFRRAVRAVVDSANTTLERAGVASSDVSWFVPHQANLRIIESAAGRIGIPRERTIVNLDRYGNTSAASIPLALAEVADDGRLQPGDLVLLSGFGAGMTWGSALLRWGRA
jgi:3-oxoacyl-[acyl-carrier-protein] synthase III